MVLLRFYPKVALKATREASQEPPSETRPLTLSNTDNKLIAAALCNPLTKVASDMCSGVQQGFLPGRQGLDHVIDIDTQLAFMNDLEFERSCGACLFDIRQAFPSLHRQWWERVLVKSGVLGFFLHSCYSAVVFGGAYLDLFSWVN